MSQPHLYGGNPPPPPTGIALSNYFGNQDSPDDMFAFSTGKIPSVSAPFNQTVSSHQLNAPLVPQSSQPSNLLCGPPTGMPRAGNDGPVPLLNQFPPNGGPPWPLDQSHAQQTSVPFISHPPLSVSDSTHSTLLPRRTSAPPFSQPLDPGIPQQNGGSFTMQQQPPSVNSTFLPHQMSGPFDGQLHQETTSCPPPFLLMGQPPHSAVAQDSQQTRDLTATHLPSDQHSVNPSLPHTGQEFLQSGDSKGPHPSLSAPQVATGPPATSQTDYSQPPQFLSSPQEILSSLVQSTGGDHAGLNQQDIFGAHSLTDNAQMQPPSTNTTDSSKNIYTSNESSGIVPNQSIVPGFMPTPPLHYQFNQQVDSNTQSAIDPYSSHSEQLHHVPQVTDTSAPLMSHDLILPDRQANYYEHQQQEGNVEVEGGVTRPQVNAVQLQASVGPKQPLSLTSSCNAQQQTFVSSGSDLIQYSSTSDTSTLQTDSHFRELEEVADTISAHHTDGKIPTTSSDSIVDPSIADSATTTTASVVTSNPPQQVVAPLKDVHPPSSQENALPQLVSPTNANPELVFQSDHQPTSLTGSNVSTGTNTPLPPVAALPFCHSHSVPNNLNGAAEKLTNAFYTPGQSLTNADCQRNEIKSEGNSLPSNTNVCSVSSPSSLPHSSTQVTTFSIGPIFSVNREEELQETSGEERAVIEGDSNPPSASQSVSSLLEGPEEENTILTADAHPDLQDGSAQTPTARSLTTCTNANEHVYPQDPGSYVPISQGPDPSPPISQDPTSHASQSFTGTTTSTLTHVDSSFGHNAFLNQLGDSSAFGTSSKCNVVTSLPAFSDNLSVLTVTNTTSLTNIKPFMPPPTVGTTSTTTLSNQVRDPIVVSNNYLISQQTSPRPWDQMMEEDTRNIDTIPSQPDGQEPLPPSSSTATPLLPPSGVSLSLSAAPTVDLTINRPPLLPESSSATSPPQSLHSSSVSAFSSVTQPLTESLSDPPPPPVLLPHSNLNRNPSLTNAGTIDPLLKSNEVPAISVPSNVVDKPLSSNQETNAKLPVNTREPPTTGDRQDDQRDSDSRPPLGGREMPGYDSFHRGQDHYRRDNRDHYQSRYGQRGGDGYYYDSHRQYRPDDQPHSRAAAYQYDPRYDYPGKGFHGDEYREGRHGHYSSYYDERDYYWRGQRSDYYQDYDRYCYDRYREDPRNQSYDERYYRDYYYPDNRGRGYEGYPPSQPHSQHHHDDDIPPPDASSIYSHHDSYMDSPGGHYPAQQHQGEFDPRESTRIDQPDYSTANYSQESYDDGRYPPDVGERYPVEGYRQEEEEPFRPIQAPPSPHVRETPLPFAHPHVCVRFGIGGHLVTVLPVKPSEQSPAVVEIHSLKTLIPQASELLERTSVLPGPLLPGDTFKSSVIKYVAQKSEECIEASQNPDLSVHKRDMASDDALLWRFLVLMCQQNGVLVPSDISDLLMREASLPMSKSPIRGVGVGGVKEAEKEDDALTEFRQFLLSGRKKDALELACRKSLWGHALMLSSRMDDQSRTYVVNRFTASLPTTDPLNTFYTMMLGRTPSVVRPEGLSRAGDWKSHLAMMVANNQDKSSIATLGDSLMSQGRVYAAHLCYHLSGLELGSDSDTKHKYSLLGMNTTGMEVPVFLPEPEDLCRTEVFEYALGLSQVDFTLPLFQTHKLLHTYRLFECGLLEKALKYCESISYYVTRDVCKYSQIFLVSLQELSIRLHHATCPLGVMETELPSWIIHLEQSMSDMRSNNHTPSISRESPSLASASNLLAQQTAQYNIATQENAFENYTGEAVPQMPGQGQLLTPPTNTHQPQSYTPVITEPLEQDFGQQLHKFNNEYGQPLASNEQPPQMVVGGVKYQSEGVDSPEKGAGSQINILSDPHSYQSQPTNPAATAGTNQFTGEAWSGYGMTTEGYGNYTESTPATNNQETGLPFGGEGYLQSDGSQVNVQDGNVQQHHYHQPSTAVSTFGLQTGSQVETPPSYSYFNSAPSFPQQSEEPSPASSQKEKQEEEDGEEEMKGKKDNGGESANRQGQSGWLGGILNWIPKGPKRARLPSDKNKRIYFDEEKKKWIDLDADEEEINRPAAPPTDNELTNKSGTHTPENQTDGGSAPPSNQYSRSRLGNGTRSKYVDVMNMGSSSNTKAPPPGAGPPPPTFVPPTMPSTTSVAPMQFNPNSFFTGTGNVPSDPLDDTSSGEVAGPNPIDFQNTTAENPPSQNQVSRNTPSLEAIAHSQAHPLLPPQHSLPSQPQRGPPPPQAHPLLPPQHSLPSQPRGPPPPQAHPLLPPQHSLPSQPQRGPPPPQGRSPRTMSEGSSTSIDLDMPGEPKNEQPPPPIQPQFFNPSAFSSITKVPGQQQQQQHLNRTDPFPDNASNRPRTRYQYPSGPMTSRPQYPLSMGTTTGGQPHPPPPGTGGKWL